MNSKTVSLNDFAPIFLNLLENDTAVEIPVTGRSMFPFLVEGRDFVSLVKINRPLRAGDVPLYKRDNGLFVLHRIQRIQNGEYFMIGDNQVAVERGIRADNLLAVAEEFNRNGKKIKINNPVYRLYSFLWIKAVPVRPVIKKIAAFVFKRKR